MKFFIKSYKIILTDNNFEELMNITTKQVRKEKLFPKEKQSGEDEILVGFFLGSSINSLHSNDNV